VTVANTTNKVREAFDEARRRIATAARDNSEELDLSGLGLTEIPAELSALRHLKVLHLGISREHSSWWNRIGDEGTGTIGALHQLGPRLGGCPTTGSL
jgi:hypothetical protein